MRLSDAILMNGMMKPQGFGSSSIVDPDEPCASGGALQSVGKQVLEEYGLATNYGVLREEWPFTREVIDTMPCGCKGQRQVYEVIYHLNDSHEWTREQIAEWVATVEPKEAKPEFYSGTLVNDLVATVALKPCVNCGQLRGDHSHLNLECPSDALRGPFYLQSRYCAEQGELACVNTVRNLARGND